MAASTKPLRFITSGLLLLLVLSYCYYLMLLGMQSFPVLKGCLTVINALGIYLNGNEWLQAISWQRIKAINATGFIVIAGVLLLTIYFVLHAPKYGSWDAIAIWNIHAKFAYYPHAFSQVYKNAGAYPHLDYPLMLPGAIAFLWHTFGQISITVPVLLSYTFFIAVPLLVYYALKGAGLPVAGMVTLVIFIIDGNFKEIAISQCADTILSALILTVFILYQNKAARQRENHTWLLGFICASCGWVKNDGLLFCLVFSVFFILLNYKNIAVILRYVAGLAIPLLIIGSFKIYYAPPSDLISAQNKQFSSLYSVLTDADRYLIIAKYFISTVFTNYAYALIVIFGLLVYNRRAFLKFPFAIIGAMLAAFFAVYLVSPYELKWHLYTSLYRVYQQLYPALIYLLMLSFGNRPTGASKSKSLII
ncbi:hypothetical protein HQ865_07660 [Mucilaginibacter mali]|uniref:Glycosyltransferase RgtA/B/C/D-like domain-containing protein n=1 Tax=Mucilaginibacter mali TaxID=2740462 RepID=A0A7D4TLX3_9SPHI|nr:hypothetical protein [Mucilaginibacter mali]QKJ29633.1 hypothetical protein HQ865_07660 [Mucilaginibacter mali]